MPDRLGRQTALKIKARGVVIEEHAGQDAQRTHIGIHICTGRFPQWYVIEGQRRFHFFPDLVNLEDRQARHGLVEQRH